MSKNAHVHALNTVSGQVGLVPASYLEHPVFGKTLVEVPEGTKSYDPEFYKPTDKEGHDEKPTNKRKLNDKKPEADNTQPALADEIQ